MHYGAHPSSFTDLRMNKSFKILQKNYHIWFTEKRVVPSFDKLQHFLTRLRDGIMGEQQFDQSKNLIEITCVLCTNNISNIYLDMIIRLTH